MKTYAPKGLRGDDLRGLLFDLAATPAQVAGYLAVSERTVWRWLAEDTAPRAALCALWLETPHGRHVGALDVGNELVIVKGLSRSLAAQVDTAHDRLARVLAISDTGAANDALLTGPYRQNTLVNVKSAPTLLSAAQLKLCDTPSAVCVEATTHTAA
ncbi:MAG: hypothetical protein ABI606_07890 [Rhodoferax sp.]